jgi:hypothetical protein
MSARNHRIYNQLSLSLKERVGFPGSYINLSVDQQAFIDAFIDANADIARDKQQLKKMLSRIKDCVYEVEDLTDQASDFIGEE